MHIIAGYFMVFILLRRNLIRLIRLDQPQSYREHEWKQHRPVPINVVEMK